MYPMEFNNPTGLPMGIGEQIPPPYTAMPFDPAMSKMPPAVNMPPAKPDALSQVGLSASGQPSSTSSLGSDQLYKYALLSALLGSAGAGIGQSFRPWVRPPQPLPSPQAPQMPITAPSALQALTQTRAARKGY